MPTCGQPGFKVGMAFGVPHTMPMCDLSTNPILHSVPVQGASLSPLLLQRTWRWGECVPPAEVIS